MRPAFSTGRHVSLANVTALRYYRMEWLNACSDRLVETGAMNASDVRAQVAELDACGSLYRIFPIVFAPCRATNR